MARGQRLAPSDLNPLDRMKPCHTTLPPLFLSVSVSSFSPSLTDFFSLKFISISFFSVFARPVQAIEEVVAKHEAAKQATVELTKNVGISRENLARVKKDNNNIKDRVATAQAALTRAEVRRGGSL